MNITPCLSHISLGSNDFEAAAAFTIVRWPPWDADECWSIPAPSVTAATTRSFGCRCRSTAARPHPATVRTSVFSPPVSNRWMNSIARRCWPVPSMKARPVRGRITVRLTTAALSGIWMGTRLKPASGMKARPEEEGKPNKKMPVIKPALYESNVLCSNSKIRK